MLDHIPFAAEAEPEWAAFVAIDWADRKHVWKLASTALAQPEHGEFDNTPEAIDSWATGLARRFPGRQLAVCLEQSRGALVYALLKYPHLVLFSVHPKTAADYRKTFAPSGAKADPSDTASLLDLLMRHRQCLRCLQPETPGTRLLQALVEQRRRLVDEKTRQKLRLVDCLKLYFPQLLRWFDDVDTPLVADLLQRWPSLRQLQRARPDTLRKFFHHHNCRQEERIQQRITAIYDAMPLTEDSAVVEGGSLQARSFKSASTK